MVVTLMLTLDGRVFVFCELGCVCEEVVGRPGFIVVTPTLILVGGVYVLRCDVVVGRLIVVTLVLTVVGRGFVYCELDCVFVTVVGRPGFSVVTLILMLVGGVYVFRDEDDDDGRPGFSVVTLTVTGGVYGRSVVELRVMLVKVYVG
jgi:hypothetical protein